MHNTVFNTARRNWRNHHHDHFPDSCDNWLGSSPNSSHRPCALLLQKVLLWFQTISTLARICFVTTFYIKVDSQQHLQARHQQRLRDLGHLPWICRKFSLNMPYKQGFIKVLDHPSPSPTPTTHIWVNSNDPNKIAFCFLMSSPKWERRSFSFV